LQKQFRIYRRQDKQYPKTGASSPRVFGGCLKGKIINSDMLTFIRTIDEDKINSMTTNDYLLLSTFFLRNGNGNIDRTQFEHLAELEIVRITEHGFELINTNRYFANRLSPINCDS
jgi:hypothetical protein